MADYFKYTTKSRTDKAINSLLGIMQGISADRTITGEEMQLLIGWSEENQSLIDRHPYNEVVPKVIQALSDGSFSEEEQEDLIWFCNKWRSQDYYKDITTGLQELHAIIGAIASDGLVTETEAERLSDWITEHEELRSCYPYDEIDSLLVSSLKDRWLDPNEQKTLLDFFSSFLPQSISLERTTSKISVVSGICAVSPEINFDGRCFCFTGESTRLNRDEMKIMALDRGARVVENISPKVNYLVVGSGGNPCWAYACYGRKIEKAMQLRQKGAQIVIVHEVDYFDAVG